MGRREEYRTWSKLCFAGFLFLVASIVASAQMDDISAQLSWGSSQKAPNGSKLGKIISAGSWGAYLFRYQPRRGFSNEQYWIESYDARMSLNARHKLLLSDQSKPDVEDIISLNQQLYLLLSRPTAEGDASRVYVRPISPRGQVTGEEKLLADLPLDEKFRRRQFDLEYSRDSSTLLLYNQLPPERDGPEQFTLRVFDDDFNLLWSRDVVLPYRDEGFRVLSYQVDQDGNVYLLGRQKSREGPKSLVPVFTLFAFNSNGREEIEYELTIDEATIQTLDFKLEGNGDIVCAGFYSISNLRESTGICHIRIDPLSRSAYKVDLSPFTEDFLLANKREEGLVDYKVKDLTLRSDGGIVLVAEQIFRQTQRIPAPQRSIVTNVYGYNNILVANLAPDGTYSWLRSIPKLQETVDDKGVYSSFAQATVQDRFFFLYNDHPSNFRPNKRRQYNFEQKESVITLTEIDRAGEQRTVPLFVNRDAGVVARPRRCRQVGARVVLVYGEEGRNYRLGLLRLDQ